jgi:hypothetical protein
MAKVKSGQNATVALEPTSYKLLYNCELMADYAMDSGKDIPQWLAESLVKITSEVKELKEVLSETDADKKTLSKNPDEYKLKINEKLKVKTGELSKIYSKLIQIVAPATPLSIEYTKPTVSFFFSGSRTIPLIRGMWITSLLFLAGLIISRVEILPLAVANPLSLFFAAGLGAYFYSLYMANRYLVNRTFDPKYVTFYYNRIIIGIIAGYILANIIDVSEILSIHQNVFTQFSSYIIAILGGFSADAVMKILNRVVATLITMVEGDAKELIKNREEELKVKFDAEITKLKLNYAGELLPLFSELEGKADEETLGKLKGLMDKWIATE